MKTIYKIMEKVIEFMIRAVNTMTRWRDVYTDAAKRGFSKNELVTALHNFMFMAEQETIEIDEDTATKLIELTPNLIEFCDGIDIDKFMFTFGISDTCREMIETLIRRYNER